MRYDATDHVGETAAEVKTLLEREFGGEAVFQVEAAASGVATAPFDRGRVVVTLRIWTFAPGRDCRGAEEKVPALAQKVEAVLFAAARDPAYPRWIRTEYLQTNYVTRRSDRPFRSRHVPAGCTEWRVCLAARR